MPWRHNRQERLGCDLPHPIHEDVGELGSRCVRQCVQCVELQCARSELDGYLVEAALAHRAPFLKLCEECADGLALQPTDERG
jgi:hypothetical protein